MIPDTRPHFHEQLRQALAGLDFRKKDVRFLLGTDEFIHHERRVALTPRHLRTLRRDLESCGLEPRIYVVRGAGDRARSVEHKAFSDAQYEAAGGEVISPAEAALLDAPDVVHALKEPTEYEGELRGPLLRLGALHLASRPSGLCPMLVRKNFAAILDGSTVGSCSYLKYGGDRTPIVASMSRFAGALSGRKVVEGLERNGIGSGKIVVVGGGVAGWSAIERLEPKARPLIVVDSYEPTRQRLHRDLRHFGCRGFEILPELTTEALTDAVGLVFAHRCGALAAEKVCHYAQVLRMRKGAAIADIAIDQGGSIAHDGYREDDDAAASRKKYQQLLGQDYFYYAETNMPREEPHEASEVHGDSSLPYVLALLGLCALHGGPMAAAREILKKEILVFNDASEVADCDLLDCVLQDLRNGLQLVLCEGRVRITDRDIQKHADLVQWVHNCAG